MQWRILFAEDEAILGKLVKESLEREPDFAVEWVKNGQEALQSVKKQAPHICVLDVMMPLMDGFSLAKQLRSSYPDLPILFLTARSETVDVVKGFSVGGNDYLKKPFSMEELVLRIHELLRRVHKVGSPAMAKPENHSFGKYWFSPATQVLRFGDVSYQLSSKEATLLEQLVLHKNQLTERKAVLMQLWGDDNFFNARTMDVYIARLRKYLVHDPNLSIVNIRGYGYKLIEQEI